MPYFVVRIFLDLKCEVVRREHDFSINSILLKHVKWPGKINFAVFFFKRENDKKIWDSQFDFAELSNSGRKKYNHSAVVGIYIYWCFI